MQRMYRFLYPMRVSIITSRHRGKEDAMPAAWVFPLSRDPPYFGVSVAKKRHSYKLISKGKAFGINLAGPRMRKLVRQTGTTTGSKVDKFSQFGIKKEYGKLKVPLLKASPVSIECRLVDVIETGDHVLFVGEAIGAVQRKEARGLYHLGGEKFMEF